MSWQQWEREQVPAPLEEAGGWRSWAPAVAFGFLAATAAQLMLIIILIMAVIGVYGPTKVPDTSDRIRVAIAAAVVLGLACALGSWVCCWRLRVRDLPARRVRRIAMITTAVFAAITLGIGFTLALTPLTLPIQLAGAVAGILLGTTTGSTKAAPPSP